MSELAPECCDYPMDIIGHDPSTDIDIYVCQINESHCAYYKDGEETQ